MSKTVIFIGVAGLHAIHVEELALHHKKLIQLWPDGQQIPLLFLGLQVSRNSLQGKQEDLRYKDRMNTREEILEACRIVKSFPHTRIIVHYNPSGDYGAPEVAEQIHWLKMSQIHGLQWNGFRTEHSLKTDPMFERHFGKNGVLKAKEFSILQIGREDFIFPEAFALRLSSFTPNYSHILFDPSFGLGKELIEHEAVDWIRVLLSKYFSKGIVLSGGLGPGGLDIIERIRLATGKKIYFSIDAEGKLHVNNIFSVDLAKKYLDEAVLLYM